MNLTGRVAIVTGGSSGIGLAVARALVSRGARVALVARSPEKLAAAARELGRDAAEVIPLDVTNRTALIALPRAVFERFGRLDVLVNNAGVNHRGALRGRTTDELAETLETNLVAPVLLTRAALDLLSDDGAVINVASLAGKVPVPDEAAYSASKSALRTFSRALHVELAEGSSRIRVCAVCPGPVDTGFLSDVARVPDLVFSQPMSTADEVAALVLRAVDEGAPEYDIPVMSGRLATLGYLWPRAFAALRPMLERRGAREKKRYLARQRRA